MVTIISTWLRLGSDRMAAVKRNKRWLTAGIHPDLPRGSMKTSHMRPALLLMDKSSFLQPAFSLGCCWNEMTLNILQMHSIQTFLEMLTKNIILEALCLQTKHISECNLIVFENILFFSTCVLYHYLPLCLFFLLSIIIHIVIFFILYIMFQVIFLHKVIWLKLCT